MSDFSYKGSNNDSIICHTCVLLVLSVFVLLVSYYYKHRLLDIKWNIIWIVTIHQTLFA